MTAFVPLNDIEAVLAQAKSGAVSVREMLRELVDAVLVVPSETEVMADGSGLRPLVFTKNDDQLVACFSEKARIGQFSLRAPYCLEINGREFFKRLPLGHGIVINPGVEVGLDISADGIARIVKDFVE